MNYLRCIDKKIDLYWRELPFIIDILDLLIVNTFVIKEAEYSILYSLYFCMIQGFIKSRSKIMMLDCSSTSLTSTLWLDIDNYEKYWNIYEQLK